jgi:hypothetical protein
MEFIGHSDPIRATFVAILQQLNRTESMNEGKERQQSLYLDDLQRILRRFWAIEEEHVKLPLALGLLLRNGLVEVDPTAAPGAPTAMKGRPRYRITTTGKQFLVDAIANPDRIPDGHAPIPERRPA